jgi:hypothetical protein
VHGKGNSVIDGADKGMLNVWLDEVSRVGEVTKAADEEVLHFALVSSRGDLQKVIHATLKQLGAIPWTEMMTQIAESLLISEGQGEQ